MEAEKNLTGNVQDALHRGVLRRLPLTFLPFVNQQLRQWDDLFPNERQSVERLLLFVAALTPAQSVELFHDVVDLEARMGVRHWQFSTEEQTIQNSSMLARSPWFQQWRQAVQAVFDASDRYAFSAGARSIRSAHRLILIDFPHALPVQPQRAWRRWRGMGRAVAIDSGETVSAFDQLLSGDAGLLRAARSCPGASHADLWVIDAGKGLSETALPERPAPSAAPAPILLSYERLDLYRESFAREMNTMHKDLVDADAVYDSLRKVDVTRWCPPELAADPLLREFVRSLFLSGNGAIIFSNSFVEWAASEALRRARPSFLAARFAVRSKPKPFTGVAVFENPDQVNPLAPVDDPEGSAVDAEMLGFYIWLAAARFDEYRASTVCVCLAESAHQLWLLAPPEFALAPEPHPLPLDRLRDSLRSWIA